MTDSYQCPVSGCDFESEKSERDSLLRSLWQHIRARSDDEHHEFEQAHDAADVPDLVGFESDSEERGEGDATGSSTDSETDDGSDDGEQTMDAKDAQIASASGDDSSDDDDTSSSGFSVPGGPMVLIGGGLAAVLWLRSRGGSDESAGESSSESESSAGEVEDSSDGSDGEAQITASERRARGGGVRS
jgi:hypothetical protein